MNRSTDARGAQLLHESPPARWSRASGAVWRSSLDQVIVSVPGSDELLVLTGTAADLWHALAESTTVDALSRRMADAFDGSADTIAADLTAALQDLATQGAVSATP